VSLPSLGPVLAVPVEQADAAPLPHWKHLARVSEGELARLDPAFVQFVTMMGFPGSERLDPAGCFRTMRAWAARVKEYTEQHRWTFYSDPSQFENSEAYFRALCLATVLQRECGVRYDMEKVPLEVPFGVEDMTVYGIVFGQGGTCVSLPVLYASVGRRLGYPIKLVHIWVCPGVGHQIARWDGGGARFNIECTGTGLCTPPDDHYRTGRFTMTREIEEKGQFLVSQTPRGELSHFLYERGLRWRGFKNWQFAAEALAWAMSLSPANVAHENTLKCVLGEWSRWCDECKPQGFPEVFIGLPRGQRLLPDELPLEYEVAIFGQMSVERLLLDPKLAGMWEAMRRGQWHGRSPRRAVFDYRADGTRELTLE
jgi:hypothetical protein